MAIEDDQKTSSSDDENIFRYLIVRPENGGVSDLVRFLVSADKASVLKFLESSDDDVVLEELLTATAAVAAAGGGNGGVLGSDRRWVIFVSIVVRKVITLFRKPMEWIGYLVEFILNLLSLNGNIFGLLYNILCGKVVMPQRGSETFISAIGHLDGRIDLDDIKGTGESASGQKSIRVELGDRALMDLCMMASKLAYENANVVRNVVNIHWKMEFVDFYDCWNDFQKNMSTQVFILCDQPKDANLILISFRGTEPFDADDWSTDFDYSWYEIPKLGKVHMGFLEALGLGNRADVSTFQKLLQLNKTNITSSTVPSEDSTSLSSSSDSFTPPENLKITAYYAVKSKLKSLLEEHKNAKFVVTGHSLGGALAILFPTVLLLHEEKEILERLLGVYTFGQPRVGNSELVNFMETHLCQPVPKYFRVVYCNDLVPRLPYDDKTFLYKHFGECLYYNSLYIEQKVDEEPNRNYFGLRYLIPEYLNAVWELMRSLMIGYVKGPEYKESWLSILLRIVGLGIPGIAAHSPTDYVNSVRLGRESTIQMSSI